MTTRLDLPILPFDSRASWESWLAEHHETSNGMWLKIAKKGSGMETVSYAEAIDAALCYGWIDGQKGRFDEYYWLQRFTPRGPRSKWSKVNREKAARLMESDEMKPPGLREVERARADGRWDAAPAARAGEERGGPRVLRHARQREQIRDPVQDSGCQKAREPGQTHREIRNHANGREEVTPLEPCSENTER